MIAECLHDREQIERFLRRDPGLHIYGLGDLDDRFWPFTTWYGGRDGDDLQALFLLYSGLSLPAILALYDGQGAAARELARAVLPLLPRRVYAHLTPGLAEVFATAFRLEPHGRHDKMLLREPARLADLDTAHVTRLSPTDREELLRLYAQSYPGHWFEPQMLATGQYYGIREGGRLVSVAGVHVHSPRYRVAALGNITTLPERRGQGHGAAVTARVCQSLLESVDTVGLNVQSDNTAAIGCYRKLGFARCAVYEESMLTAGEG